MIQFLAGAVAFILFSQSPLLVLWPAQSPLQRVTGVISRAQRGCGEKRITHFHPVTMFRISGTRPPFPDIPSWDVKGLLHFDSNINSYDHAES